MVGYLDRYSRQDSVCHRIQTKAKLLIAMVVTCISLAIPADFWPVQLAILAVVFAGQSLARIPVDYLRHRLIRFLPFVLLFCSSIWLGTRGEKSGILALNLCLRSVVCFMAALWLVNIVPFDQLLAELRTLGLPRVAGALLAFMYRYLFVVFDELDRMRQARNARSFGRISLSRQWGLRGQMIGMLLVRGVSRAERVHGAMCARGWDGVVRRLSELSESEQFQQRDRE